MQASASHLTWSLSSAAWCLSLSVSYSLYHLYSSSLLQHHPLLTPTPTELVATTVTTPTPTAGTDAPSAVTSACTVHETGPNPLKQCMQAV